MGNSLGFIEVVGMLGAIEACDAAVKSAYVELVGCELTKGSGWVTITLKGDVAAVKAGVDAAVASAERVAKVVSYTVIARPSDQLGKINPDKTAQSIRKKDEESENKDVKDEKKVIEEKPLAEAEKAEEKIAQPKASPEKAEEKIAQPKASPEKAEEKIAQPKASPEKAEEKIALPKASPEKAEEKIAQPKTSPVKVPVKETAIVENQEIKPAEAKSTGTAKRRRTTRTAKK